MSRFGKCQIGSLFRRCKHEGVATCQYCGLTFCSDHGMFLEDNQEICLRQQCQAKRLDLERHLVWKGQAMERNVALFCGIETCESDPKAQCSKCRAIFCVIHIHEREQPVRESGGAFTQHVAVCDHCWERRIIWSKK